MEKNYWEKIAPTYETEIFDVLKNDKSGKIVKAILNDPNFKRTIILLSEHSEEGSVGFVLNKPTDYRIHEVIEEFPEFDAIVFYGGPVQLNTLQFIYKGDGIIDGSTPVNKRKEIVDRIQAGQLQVVFCHPQSAGHGLTMTKAKTVIWASPTYNAEHYQQFNRRIYRAGQTEKTEIIQIAARDTWETDVYEKLEGKVERMDDLLGILNKLNPK